MNTSIIIPIYNVEKYLKECIDSVINQTINDYEIILVNDGSTDRSGEIAKDYSCRYDNITLINQENKGQSAARNVGLKASKGAYILYCDSDDTIEPNLLEICYEKMKKNGLDVVYFGYKVKNECRNLQSYGDYVNTLIEEDKVLTGEKFLIKSVSNLCISTCNQFIKKDFLINNNLFFEEGIIYEDIEFTINVLMKSQRVMNIQQKLYTYRQRENSTTTEEVTVKNIESLQKIIINIINIANYKNSDDLTLLNALKKMVNYTVGVLMLNNSKIIIKKSNIQIQWINSFIRYYFHVFSRVIEDADYFMINKLIEMLFLEYKDIDKSTFINYFDKDVMAIYLNSIELINKFKQEMLRRVPFMDSKKHIAIYGVGRHTQSLLKYYEENIGLIKCNLVFIDSFSGYNNEKMYGKSIINVNNVNNYKLDCVLISSASYEDELYSNIIKILKREIPIYKFYDTCDIVLFS